MVPTICFHPYASKRGLLPLLLLRGRINRFKRDKEIITCAGSTYREEE